MRLVFVKVKIELLQPGDASRARIARHRLGLVLFAAQPVGGEQIINQHFVRFLNFKIRQTGCGDMVCLTGRLLCLSGVYPQ